MGSFNKPGSNDVEGNEKSNLYSSLLKNELLGYEIEDMKDVTPEKRTPNRALFNVSS